MAEVTLLLPVPFRIPKMGGSTMNRISSSELPRQAQWRSGRGGIPCRCWASPIALALDCMQTATGEMTELLGCLSISGFPSPLLAVC